MAFTVKIARPEVPADIVRGFQAAIDAATDPETRAKRELLAAWFLGPEKFRESIREESRKKGACDVSR